MKNLWIIANWKSNKNIDEAVAWFKEVGNNLHLAGEEGVNIVVCPQFEQIYPIREIINSNNFPILIGSQNLSPFNFGAFTGEVSAQSLKGLVDLSILGHSERRHHFNETDEMIAKKVEQAKENNITPLVCVQGENTPVPNNCKLIAYEPIFAIGTDTPDTPENANDVASKLKSKNGNDLIVLYGGSVTSQNCQEFITQENLNGLLIGRASLDPHEFIAIIDNCLSAAK